jgi:hypothetical protein
MSGFVARASDDHQPSASPIGTPTTTAIEIAAADAEQRVSDVRAQMRQLPQAFGDVDRRRKDLRPGQHHREVPEHEQRHRRDETREESLHI